jgi:hypothetical protein
MVSLSILELSAKYRTLINVKLIITKSPGTFGCGGQIKSPFPSALPTNYTYLKSAVIVFVGMAVGKQCKRLRSGPYIAGRGTRSLDVTLEEDRKREADSLLAGRLVRPPCHWLELLR